MENSPTKKSTTPRMNVAMAITVPSNKKKPMMENATLVIIKMENNTMGTEHIAEVTIRNTLATGCSSKKS